MLLFDVAHFPHRAVAEAKTETTVQGPNEAFNEHLTTNLGLLRKRIQSSNFRVEQMKLGTSTESRVLLSYMQDLAPTEVVNECRNRIRAIETDSILDSTYIVEWIADKTFIPFPLIMKTERPDVTVSHILEGRVAILVDGSPIALIGPVTFFNILSRLKIISKERMSPLLCFGSGFWLI